jgi:hypothetical protein
VNTSFKDKAVEFFASLIERERWRIHLVFEVARAGELQNFDQGSLTLFNDRRNPVDRGEFKLFEKSFGNELEEFGEVLGVEGFVVVAIPDIEEVQRITEFAYGPV